MLKMTRAEIARLHTIIGKVERLQGELLDEEIREHIAVARTYLQLALRKAEWSRK